MNPIDTENPLENNWSFWHSRYIGPSYSTIDYNNGLAEIGTFGTIQNFWRWYNNLPKVATFRPGTTFYLMKKGIKPVWEDEYNANGGHYFFKIHNNYIDDVWLYLILGAIGEQFNENICGLAVSIRKNQESVIQIWNKSANEANLENMKIFIVSIIPKIQYIIPPIYKAHNVK